MMYKAMNAIFYVASRPSLCCRLIGSGLMHEAKRSLALFLFIKQEIKQLQDVTFELIDFRNPPSDVDLEEFAGLLAVEKEWQKDGSEAEDEDEPSNHNSKEAPLISQEDLAMIKEETLKELCREKKRNLVAWETVAERLCIFAGQVALKTLIHVDVSFVAEMKRKNELLHLLRTSLSDEDSNMLVQAKCIEDFSETREITALESESIERQGFFEIDEEDDGDRLGLTGMSEEERVIDRAQRICENAVSRRGTFLNRMSKFLLPIVKSKSSAYSERLRSAAMLALAKFMLLSMKTCTRYMPLFLEYLEKSPSARCRSNLLIAAGDLCFRFPNIIEKYSEHLYNGLVLLALCFYFLPLRMIQTTALAIMVSKLVHTWNIEIRGMNEEGQGINDKDDYVRQTCIIVLSHLMLNDMVKVRGTVADLAQCTIDENVNVAQLAKFFFSELAKKSNVLYNLMPDIISRLSSCETVTTDNFIKIMKLLLTYIKKEKQADSLLEKLIQRMQGLTDKDGVVDARLAQCISYCLSCLPLSEKSFRYMAETLPTYSNLLSLESVYTNLQTAVTHFRKSSARNNELKNELDDFLESLSELHQHKVEQEGLISRGMTHKKKFKPPLSKVKKVR